MTTYPLDSLEHQATRAFFRRQSEKARRRRRWENLAALALALVAANTIIYLLIKGF